MHFPEEQGSGIEGEEKLLLLAKANIEAPCFTCPDCPNGAYSCGLYPEEHNGECPLEHLYNPEDCCPDFDGG